MECNMVDSLCVNFYSKIQYIAIFCMKKYLHRIVWLVNNNLFSETERLCTTSGLRLFFVCF